MKAEHLNKKSIYLPRVGSTNRELFKEVESGSLPEGAVLWTDDQHDGRGMGNSTWESIKGLNITASFLLYPEFLEPEKQFYLNKAISLSVYDTVSSLLQNEFKTEIKWPNDILVDGNKVAGILIENLIQGSKIKCTVAGIGINVNQTQFENYPLKPTSLKKLTGKHFDIKESISILSGFVEERYNLLKSDPKNLLDKDYLSKLYRYQLWANYKTKGKEFEAKICGIDKYGKLLLETKFGNIESYDLKEVEFVD